MAKSQTPDVRALAYLFLLRKRMEQQPSFTVEDLDSELTAFYEDAQAEILNFGKKEGK